MSRQNGIIISYDILLNPLAFALLFPTFGNNNIYIKQIELHNFLREISMIVQLVQNKIKPIPFSSELHKALIKLEAEGFIESHVKLKDLPKPDLLKKSILSTPEQFINTVYKYKLQDEHPKEVFSSLAILKFVLENDFLKILPEKQSYEKASSNIISPTLYDDLFEQKIDYYPFLPRYSEHNYRRDIVGAALTTNNYIATTNPRFREWLDTNLISTYQIPSIPSFEFEDIINCDPNQFTVIDAIQLINQEVHYELLDKILKIKQKMTEKQILGEQLMPDFVLLLLGLHPLGSIPNAISLLFKYLRYKKIK